jgi:hypothetical protein
MGLDYLGGRQRIDKLNIQLGEAYHGLEMKKKKISIFLKPINY